jgi:hypothetical protein
MHGKTTLVHTYQGEKPEPPADYDEPGGRVTHRVVPFYYSIIVDGPRTVGGE